MGLSPIVVRGFRPDDARAILTLFYETVRTVNAADYTAEQIAAWTPEPPERMDAAGWRDRLAAMFTVVAEHEDGRILGFADLEPASLPGASTRNGHLDHLYVHKDHQGAGVATALLEAVEREAVARGMVRIFTEASLTARPFFARRGYATIAEQTVVLAGTAMPNVRMAKRL